MRFKYYIGLFLLSFILLFIACSEDDDLIMEDGAVVFKIEANIDQQEMVLSAGEDNYFMHTSYAKDTGQIYSFNGILGNFSCPDSNNCTRSLQIELRDNAITNNEISNIHASLTPKDYHFRKPVDSIIVGYEIQFQSDVYGASTNNYTYYWDFGDGTTSSDANPKHFYTIPSSGTWVNPCVTITNTASGYTSSLCNEINLVSDCYPDIEFTVISSNPYQFSINGSLSSGNQPVVWRTDPDTIYSPIIPSFIKSDPITRTCITNNTGDCNNVKCINVIPDPSFLDGVINFDYKKSIVKQPTSAAHDFSDITVTWFNENGTRFKSDLKAQPSSSSFKIIGIADYKNNENGELTKIMEIEFSCNVYKDLNFGNFDSIQIVNGRGSFGVAYP